MDNCQKHISSGKKESFVKGCVSDHAFIEVFKNLLIDFKERKGEREKGKH